MKCFLTICALCVAVQSLADMRVWTVGNKSVEAEYVNIIGDKLILKSVSGKTSKVPVSALSAEDRIFIELLNPPGFTIGFLKKGDQRFVETGPYIENVDASFMDYEFGARIKQKGTVDYPHELKIEYFAIGGEVKTYGDKYILLDRGESNVTLSEANGRSHAFTGNVVELMQYVYGGDKRGTKYEGYLIVVTDARGEIIATEASKEWLIDLLVPLRELPIGAYMDENGTRTHPTRPKPFQY